MVLLYFTLKDKIVKEAMGSLSPAGKNRDECPVVVGGMAVQLHCQDMIDRVRPTSDTDVIYIPEINSYSDFSSGIGGEIAEHIKSHGYQVALKKVKHRPNCEVKIMDGQGNKAKERFFIHFDGVPTNKPKSCNINKRQVENASEIGYSGSSVYVLRPEDILASKLKRLKRKMIDAGDVSGLEQALFNTADSARWSELAKTPLEPWLDHIIDVQNSFPPEQVTLPTRYVIDKDFYDICLLARKIEGTDGMFNKAYFANARNQWSSL